MVTVQVVSKLQQPSAGGEAGLLIGHPAGTGGSLVVIDLLCIPSTPLDLQVNLAISHLLPYGLHFVGVHAASKEAAVQLLQQPQVNALLSSCIPGLPDGSVLIATPQGSTYQYSLYTVKSASWQEVASQSHNTPADLALCRCSLSVPLDVYLPLKTAPGAAQDTQSVKTAASLLAQSLAARTTRFLLHTRDYKQLLVSCASKGSVKDHLASSSSPASTLDTPAFTAQPIQDPLNMDVTQGKSSSTCPGPVYEYQVAAGQSLTLHRALLHISALVLVPLDTQLADLGRSWLLPALLKQVEGASSCVSLQPHICSVRAHHFQPPGRSYYITLLYPEPAGQLETTELKLAPFRRVLHQVLGLPLNRPLLRTANARPLELGCQSASQVDGSQATSSTAQRLKDVHNGLTNPVPGGVVWLLDGTYEYYHYMQDRFNDAGWGCAYRSLQTIISWFRQQQYSNKPVPSHREIQQILVKMGDKQSEFIGSSNWIGAIELSYILDEYLGVTSKILTINKGSDIPSHARELAAHFANQGTPVMIGGGVLAYTLLGVSFNELTGDCAFLILDPHYTGGEDLRKIQTGTWVAWKKPGDQAAAGGPLFVQDAFYNFLCPQRPKEV